MYKSCSLLLTLHICRPYVVGAVRVLTHFLVLSVVLRGFWVSCLGLTTEAVETAAMSHLGLCGCQGKGWWMHDVSLHVYDVSMR